MHDSKGLHIGFIIYGSLESVSGGYLYDRKIVEGLRQRGARVEILSLPLRNYGRHLADNVSAALLKEIKKKHWDVLIQDELAHPSLIVLNRHLRRTEDYPIVSLVHHLRCCESRSVILNAFYRAAERHYLGTVHGFIFNSETTRDTVRGVLKHSRPGVVAYPGRDHILPGSGPEGILKRCQGPGPLRILFLGNIIPRKGLHILIRGLAMLPGRRWQLTVAGDLSTDAVYARRMQELAGKMPLADSIRFTGRVAAGDLPGLFEAHHCLAMPSLYEGFGIACLEAMGFGQPVIATSAGAGPEWIREGEEGWIIPPGNASALTGAVRKWIEDRGLLLRMSLAAFRKYSDHPAWSDSAQKVHAFLKAMSASCFPNRRSPDQLS